MLREPIIHVLKIRTEYFKDVKSGRKTFEFRWDDRDYRLGDTLQLSEWRPIKRKFTGRSIQKKILSVFRPFHIDASIDFRWVILSLGDV